MLLFHLSKTFSRTKNFDHQVLDSAPVLVAGTQHDVSHVNKLKNQAQIHQDNEKPTHTAVQSPHPRRAEKARCYCFIFLKPWQGLRMFDHHVLNSAPVLAAGTQHDVSRVNKLKNQARIHQDKEKLTHTAVWSLYPRRAENVA